MLLVVRVQLAWLPGFPSRTVFQSLANLFFHVRQVRLAVTKIKPAHDASEEEHTRDQDTLKVLQSGQSYPSGKACAAEESLRRTKGALICSVGQEPGSISTPRMGIQAAECVLPKGHMLLPCMRNRFPAVT